MKNAITFIIPTNYNNGRQVEPAKMESIKLMILDEFNGLTEETNKTGYWKEDGKIYKDNVNFLISFYDGNKDAIIKQISEHIKAELKQLSLSTIKRVNTKTTMEFY